MLFGSINYKDYNFEVYCEPKEATLKFYIFPQSVEAFKFVGINAVDRRPYSVKVNKTTIELPLNPEDKPNLPFYKMLGAIFNTASISFLSGENIGTSEEPKYKFKVEPVDYIYKATLGILTEFQAESSDISIKLSSVAETDKLLTELRTSYLYGTSKKTIRYKLSDFAYIKHGLEYSITEAKKKKEKQVKSTQVLPDGYVNIEEFYHTPAEVFSNNKNAAYSWLLDREYVIVTDEDFQATMNYFNQFKMIAMDTETTGLRINQMMHKDPSKADKLVGIILCAEPGKSYYFPIGHEAHFPLHDTTSIDETYDPCIAEPTSIKNLFNGDMQAFIAAMKPLLEEKEYITFNADFDWRVMYGYHVNLNVIFDVYAAFMLTKNAEIGYLTNNLKAWTERALNRKALELDNISKSGTWSKKNAFSFKDLPYELVRLYACADADNTLELYNYLIYNHIVTDLASPELVKLETKFMLAVAYQEFYGHHIDPAELANLKETLTKDAADMLGKFLECLDNKGIAHANFNIKSSMQLLDVLYSEDKLNIPVQKDPKTGKPTTSAKVLAKLLTPGGPEEQQYPEIYYLDAYRKAAKLLQDFTVFLDDPDFEGYLYSDVKQFLNTGRVAVSNPNYQSYNDEAKKYVTPREGYYMMDYDYSSIESRIIASMAQEPYLIEAFADPDLDYHKLQASKLYNIPYEKVTKKMRKASKALNFGIPYGMSDKELGRIIFGELNDRNTNEAKRLKDLYFKVQPNVKKYFAKNKEDGVHRGYTETFFGRRRYYPKNQPEYKRALAAGNAPIQGTGADIFKSAVGKIFEAIFYNNLQGKILISAFVHDECVLEVSKEIHPCQILALVKQLAEMAKLQKQGFVPIYIGAGFGNSWYEAKSGEIPLFLQDEMIANPDKFYTNWPEDANNLYNLTMGYVKAHELNRAINTITNKENDGKILKAIVYDYIIELLADKGLKPVSEDMNDIIKQFAKAYNVDTSKVVTFVEAEEPSTQQEDTAVLVGTIEVQVDDLLVNDIQIINDDTTKAVVIKIPDSCLQDQTPVQQFLVANSGLYTNEDDGYQLWYAYQSSDGSYKSNQLLGYNIKQDGLISFVQSYKQFIINQQALAGQKEMLSYQGG